MPNFYDLPRELRDVIYEELLICPSSHIFMDVYCGEVRCSRTTHVRMTYDEDNPNFDQFLYPAILLANKKTYQEAIALLYSKNHFRIEQIGEWSATLLSSFLLKIGPQNASLLHHIDIAFPRHDRVLEEGQGIIALQEGTTRVLDLIKDKCTGIQTLETTLISTDHALRDTIASNMGKEEASEFLTLVATRLEAIPSLREIILHVHEEPVDHVKEKISAFGWRLKITERVEDDSIDDDSEAEYDDYAEAEYDDYAEYEDSEEDWGF